MSLPGAASVRSKLACSWNFNWHYVFRNFAYNKKGGLILENVLHLIVESVVFVECSFKSFQGQVSTFNFWQMFRNSPGGDREGRVVEELLFHTFLSLGDGGVVRSTETCADLAQSKRGVAPAQDNRQRPRRVAMADAEFLPRLPKLIRHRFHDRFKSA